MNRGHLDGNSLLTGLGMMIAAPVVLMAAAMAVLILSLPVLMALIVVAFATAILFVGTAVTKQTPIADSSEGEDAMCDSVDLFAALDSETVVMVETLTDAPKSPVSATVTKVVGPCPLGMMPGNTWQIGPDGKLSRPMCRPGATALSALFLIANGDVLERSACCECVIEGREVTFTVREPAVEPG